MTDLSNTKSVLKLSNFYFTDIRMDRRPSFDGLNYPAEQLAIGFAKEHNVDKNNNTLTLVLHIKISISDAFQLFLTSVGEFCCNIDNDETVLSYLKNAMAIMFPYIRSEITLLTSQPNLKPIIIPPININALFEKLDLETKTENN